MELVRFEYTDLGVLTFKDYLGSGFGDLEVFWNGDQLFCRGEDFELVRNYYNNYELGSEGDFEEEDEF